MLYYVLVFSYLQYCITVWGSTYPSNLHRIVLIQKRVITVISKEAYLLQLGTFMRKYNNLLPLTFDNSFIKIHEIHTYNTRSSKQYYILTCIEPQFTANYQGPLFLNFFSPYFFPYFFSLFFFFPYFFPLFFPLFFLICFPFLVQIFVMPQLFPCSSLT